MASSVNQKQETNFLTLESLTKELSTVDLEASSGSAFSYAFNRHNYRQTQENIEKYLRSISENCGNLDSAQKRKIAEAARSVNPQRSEIVDRNLSFLLLSAPHEARAAIQYMRSQLAAAKNHPFEPVFFNPSRCTAQEIQEQYLQFEKAVPKWHDYEVGIYAGENIARLRHNFFDEISCRPELFFLFLCLQDHDPSEIEDHFMNYMLDRHDQIIGHPRGADIPMPKKSRERELPQSENIPLNICKSLKISNEYDVLQLCQEFILAFQAGATKPLSKDPSRQEKTSKEGLALREKMRKTRPEQAAQQSKHQFLRMEERVRVLPYDKRANPREVQNTQVTVRRHRSNHKNVEAPSLFQEKCWHKAQYMERLEKFIKYELRECNLQNKDFKSLFYDWKDGKDVLVNDEAAAFYQAALDEILAKSQKAGRPPLKEDFEVYVREHKAYWDELLWPPSFYGIGILPIEACKDKTVLSTVKSNMLQDDSLIKQKYRTLLEQQGPGATRLTDENYQKLLSWIEEAEATGQEEVDQLSEQSERMLPKCYDTLLPTIFSLWQLQIPETKKAHGEFCDKLIEIGVQVLEGHAVSAELAREETAARRFHAAGKLSKEGLQQALAQIAMDRETLRRIVHIASAPRGAITTAQGFCESVRNDVLLHNDAFLGTGLDLYFPSRAKKFLQEIHLEHGGKLPAPL